jgi:hypothetical protein
MAMGRYSVKTELSPEEVVEKAKAYFGEGGTGLEITEEGACCITFEGGGGFISVSVDVEGEESEPTEVELMTREWTFDVKQFMKVISN